MGPDPRLMTRAQAATADIDVGLRQYMLRVYNYMTGGLAVTGIIAYVVGTNPTLLNAIYGTPLAWVVMFAPLVLVMVFSFRLQKMSVGAAQAVFWAFAALMGLSISYIFAVYTGVSIARVFFITAGTFAATSLYGYTTKRDLTGMGSFPPTRRSTRSWSTRRSLAWSPSGSSPISSRKQVLPSAVSSSPRRMPTAPVKAPRSWPNSSDSNRFSGSAAQSMATNGRSARGLA